MGDRSFAIPKNSRENFADFKIGQRHNLFLLRYRSLTLPPSGERGGSPPGGRLRIDHAHRDPHQEPGKLLGERAQSPKLGASSVPAVQRDRRHRDEAAEKAAVHQRGESRAERRPGSLTRPGVENRPPEQEARSLLPTPRRTHAMVMVSRFAGCMAP